ncbi:MAG: hypothetical protein ACK55Z_27470, partial [bacterium]
MAGDRVRARRVGASAHEGRDLLVLSLDNTQVLTHGEISGSNGVHRPLRTCAFISPSRALAWAFISPSHARACPWLRTAAPSPRVPAPPKRCFWVGTRHYGDAVGVCR